MIVIDVLAKNKIKYFLIYIYIYIFIFLIVFLGLGSLNPMECCGAKSAGHSQFTVAINALSYPQVHELLIRCCIC